MGRTESTRIRLTGGERAALEAAARASGCTVSEVLRRAIRAHCLDPLTNEEGRTVVHKAAGAPFRVQSIQSHQMPTPR